MTEQHEQKEGHTSPTHSSRTEHHAPHHSGKSFDVPSKWVLSVLIVLLAVISFSVYQSSTLGGELTKRIAIAQEEARPAQLQIIAIKDAACSTCFDVGPIIEAMKGYSGVNVTKEEILDYSSESVKGFIEKYDIKRVPTLLVSGEVNKSSALIGTFADSGFSVLKEGELLLFEQQHPPYVDVASNAVIGLVDVTVLEPSNCTVCFNVSLLLSDMSSSGIVFNQRRFVDAGSEEGQAVVSKYGIASVPSAILSKDFGAYAFAANWPQLGSVEEDGKYVLRNVNPPYLNLTTGEVMGEVSITYLFDSSCEKCHDPVLHKTILRRLNMAITRERRVDIQSAEGKQLVEQYNITAAPTIILSQSAGDYEAFLRAWNGVGTAEEDGSYVFRNIAVLNAVYKDLRSGRVIEQRQQQAQ